MARLIRALVGGALLAGASLLIAAAQSDVCVPDEQTSCPAPVATEDPSVPNDAVAPDVAEADVVVPEAQPAPADTRLIEPATVVQPFTQVIAPAAPVTEVLPAQSQPPNPQKLPPGPPSRYP